MKAAPQSVLFLIMAAVHCAAGPQVERLRATYKAQGDGLLVTLCCLPETRETVQKHVPKREGFSVTLEGYLPRFWKGLNDEAKLRILDAVGSHLADLEEPKREETWQRIQDWPLISSQWSLLSSFSADHGEGILEIAHSDPLIRPAFDTAIKRRPVDFPEELIVQSMSSSEVAAFPHTVIIPLLLAASEKQRFRCLSRLFEHLAELKHDEADAADQPATAGESK